MRFSNMNTKILNSLLPLTHPATGCATGCVYRFAPGTHPATGCVYRLAPGTAPATAIALDVRNRAIDLFSTNHPCLEHCICMY